MNYFYHLGYHKTGSTHLQKQIFGQSKNTYLLTRPNTVWYNALNKLRYALDVDYSEAETLQLYKNLAIYHGDNKNVLVSDETLLGAPNRNYLNRSTILTRLASASPGAHAIVFLRGQLDLIESMYNQYIKVGGYSGEFDRRFIALNNIDDSCEQYGVKETLRPKNLSHPVLAWMDVSRFKYTSLLKELHQNFEHVHVILYEDLLKDPGSVYARLGDILDDKTLASIKPPKQNDNPNIRLSESYLSTCLISERMRKYFPFIHHYIRWPTSRVLSLFCKKGFEKRKKQHLELLKNEAGFGEDNKIVNQKYNLGMEKYPENYLLVNKL